ncbi:DUF397 domain-containing protein [Nocardia terpenica]|uniref:DUF397 domain-containing protein n=1 Tax=Nocardia terpenica TaxID=455432 RepID=A0A6G9Z4R3_9NOCA|nr:DUF397 domain-containing protein [Nocardia terpenica]QIS20579.1 DUF397 domain-containing protein [Nocardia terpenica]
MTIEWSGAHWFKSSHSGASQDCVEIAFLGTDHIGVRDSKNPTGPALAFTPAEWDAFTDAVKTNQLAL